MFSSSNASELERKRKESLEKKRESIRRQMTLWLEERKSEKAQSEGTAMLTDSHTINSSNDDPRYGLGLH